MHLPLAHQTLAIVGVAIAVALVQPAAALTETEERGRQIFTIGSDGSAAITARVGPVGTRIPARGVPCAGCHGADGMGRPEGGSFPPNVTWAALTKPYGYRHANGRVRHAYTEERLMRVLRDGIDAAGNRLEVVMPRYELSDAQARDLIAYMKRLGLENDPGITDTELSLGTLLPSHGRLGEIGESIEQILAAAFTVQNAEGGIHGRRLSLRAVRYGGEASAPEAAARLAQAGVFAVIAPFLAEDEDVIAVHLGAASVPTLGPITLFAPADAQTRPAIFNLSAGLDDQVRALVDYATKHLLLGTVPMAVLAPSDSRYAPAAAAAEAQRARQGGAPVLRLTYAVPDDAKGLVEGMSRLGVETVIYLGAPSSLANLLQAARHAAWRPTVLASGSSVDRSIVAMPALGGPTLYAAYPLLRSDQSPAGAVEFRRLHEQSGIPDRHVPVQILAFAATKLFLEAARRAGRALTRERLVTILEDMRSFDTGVLRPLTYGPGRRVGTLGAHIVPIEFAGTTLSNDRLWIVPDPL